MPFRTGAIIFASLVAIAASSAGGAADNQEREWRAACTHDALVHCPFSALSGDRTGVRSCLIKHLDRISARCRADVIGASAVNDRNTGDSSAENALSRR